MMNFKMFHFKHLNIIVLNQDAFIFQIVSAYVKALQSIIKEENQLQTLISHQAEIVVNASFQKYKAREKNLLTEVTMY